MRTLLMIATLSLLSTGASRCQRAPRPSPEEGGGSAGSAEDGRGPRCGEARCDRGQVCCNESCGICTEPGGFCTQQFCGDPEPEPTSPFCGGIAGFPCPGAGRCVDDPSDD
jgi:hypothetical protein